jgi:hypothetical protein
MNVLVCCLLISVKVLSSGIQLFIATAVITSNPKHLVSYLPERRTENFEARNQIFHSPVQCSEAIRALLLRVMLGFVCLTEHCFVIWFDFSDSIQMLSRPHKSEQSMFFYSFRPIA